MLHLMREKWYIQDKYIDEAKRLAEVETIFEGKSLLAPSIQQSLQKRLLGIQHGSCSSR
jgi:hypothetical protein